MKVTRLAPVLNVSDVPASLAWFEKLGWQRSFTWNDGGMIAAAADGNAAGPAQFGAVFTGECEIFQCKDGQGSRGGPLPKHAGDDDTGGVWMSWWLETPADVDAAHALARSHEMTIARPPTNEPWGVREFHLCHPDGHTFRVSAQLRHGKP
jgi:catechol 2,3-dioxygenase-like lactoylglutathione lyase family enzyme